MASREAAMKLLKLTYKNSMELGRKTMYYSKVELAPPTQADIPAIKESLVNILRGITSLKFLNVTVRETWLNAMVATEVVCWFYIGECIGKRHLVGYKV